MHTTETTEVLILLGANGFVKVIDNVLLVLVVGACTGGYAAAADAVPNDAVVTSHDSSPAPVSARIASTDTPTNGAKAENISFTDWPAKSESSSFTIVESSNWPAVTESLVRHTAFTSVPLSLNTKSASPKSGFDSTAQ